MSPAGRKITEKLSDEALTAATGRGWGDWFALLDAWGAAEQSHAAIARHLVDAHHVGGWHAQSITVAYEQERGLRQVGQSSAGDWQASVSRTVAAPAERCSAAFADEELRLRWLPVGELAVRTHRPGKSLTADWDGGPSRISVYLTPKGEAKTQIGLGHTRLPDAEAVAAYKEFWQEHLTELKTLLESEPPGSSG
ncbi:SRPBCC domain-containing protein [Streptomyces sp. NPDC048604]|uniref:SRPBCC domain-containing protein n=1 Tax=Streptomyces sp. NPDC048604 TaxID=3365578 RepID=UPI003720823C